MSQKQNLQPPRGISSYLKLSTPSAKIIFLFKTKLSDFELKPLSCSNLLQNRSTRSSMVRRAARRGRLRPMRQHPNLNHRSKMYKSISAMRNFGVHKTDELADF